MALTMDDLVTAFNEAGVDTVDKVKGVLRVAGGAIDVIEKEAAIAQLEQRASASIADFEAQRVALRTARDAAVRVRDGLQ